MNIKSNIAKSKLNRKKTFNKITIPRGFVLISDTREQKPLFNPIPEKLIQGELIVITKTLKHGDYSIKGFEDQICIERKQASDFHSYIGKEREKTSKKLYAMNDMFFKALVIELQFVWRTYTCYKCKQKIRVRTPQNIYDTVISSSWTTITVNQIDSFIKECEVKHNMHVFWTPDRELLQRYVLTRLVFAYKKVRELT